MRIGIYVDGNSEYFAVDTNFTTTRDQRWLRHRLETADTGSAHAFTYEIYEYNDSGDDTLLNSISGSDAEASISDGQEFSTGGIGWLVYGSSSSDRWFDGLVKVDDGGDGDDGEETIVSVTTNNASNVSESSATLNGSLDDLGGADSTDVYFEWGLSGNLSNTTEPQTLSSTGTFSEELSELEAGEEYEYRAVAEASDGDIDTGSSMTFTTTTSDTGVAVSTASASNVGESSATLNGSLDDLGGADSADVYFEWGPSGDLSNTTEPQTLSSTGPFSEEITGLEAGEEYEYRAVAEASDGDTDTGSSITFTTTTVETSVAVSTASASNVSESSATLNGELTELTGADPADVYFEWGESGAGLPNRTDGQTLDSTGAFDELIDGLDQGTAYEFRAIAETGEVSDTGDIVTFTTEEPEPETSPVINRFELSDTSNPAWARVEVDWAVSDEDGDLNEVTTVLNGGVDSEISNVSGSSASGTHELRERNGHGEAEVTLTVIDAQGNETSATETIELSSPSGQGG
ncbi:hypothetical protein [Halalkalicoccus salilacus]